MLVCIVLLIGLVTLFACNKSDVADKDGQTKVIVKIQNEDGSIYKENVVFSDLFTLSLQKEGYTGRLYRDADFLKPLTKDSKVKNGDTVYVKWTINKYTVTFMDGKDVLKAYPNVTHGSAVTAPEVSKKDGKTFVGWDNKFDNVTSDLTINAVYDVDTFTVTFKDGEKVLETQTVEYEAAAIAPDTARLSPPEGMHFAKWDKDFSKVTEDIEVSAVYELNEYTVTFKNGETEIKTETVKHGFAATAPKKVPDKATEKFVGWDKPFDNVTSDLIVNAQFETKKFTLTFINFDGTTVYTEEVKYGASIEEPFDKADKAATYDTKILDYDGWYKVDGTRIDELDLPTMPAENFTLTLKLSLMDSAIGEFTVNNTPAEGFTFTESNTAEFSVMPNEGTTLHAGVTYKYIWTINKDNVIYKTEETTLSSLTLQNLDAGKYFANVKIVASMKNCGTVEKDFSAGETLIVSRADISGIEVTDVTMTYGDKTAKIGISGSGLREGDVVTYGTDGTTFPLQNVDLSALNAGEYKYYVKVERNENYNAYFASVAINIEKAAVTIRFTPDKNEVVYGDELPSLSAYVGETKIGTVAKEDYALKLNEISFSGIATYVGECSIEVKNFSNDYYNTTNFNITFNSPDKITVKKATLNVNIAKINNLTYGDDLPEIGYEIKGWKNGDDKSEYKLLPETKYAKKSAVGTYSFTYNVSGEKIENYKIMVNKVYFDVVKRDAKITVNDVQNIIYGDKVPDLSASVKDVLAGDSLSYTLETDYTVGKKPGKYTASVVVNAEAAENKNYAITTTVITFYVGTKALEIKLDSNVSVGNVAKTYTVEVGSQDLVIGELATGDVIEGSVSITSSEGGTFVDDKAFQKNIVIKNAAGEVVTAYYEIKYNLKVVFVKYDFEINADDKTVTYNGAPQNVDLVTWDASKTYKVMYGTAANECNAESLRELNCINAGTYTIYFKVVDNDTLAEEKGSVTLTINKKAVEVKVKDVKITYGETPKFEYTVSELVDGETLSGEAVYSGEGTDAGDYEISVSGLTASDNYNVSFVPGKLTINKKTAEVAWTIAESYVYNDGQTLPTATYDKKTANLIFTKDGKACEFKNAGTYTVTIADDNNYDLTGSETTKTIVINKARYTAAPALSLSGTYAPDKTLGNYELSEGFAWADADEVPVCTKTEYAAKYNMDPENYEDFETKVTLVLQKATVTLAQNLFEFNYDGASHEIGTTVRYNNIEVTEPYTLTFEKNMFSAAGTHKTTATLTADNFALSDNVVYVKVKGVKLKKGNEVTYHTIEDALSKSESGDTIEFINGVKEVPFAPRDVAEAIYADKAYRKVKEGVTLILASDEDSSATIGKPTYGAGSARYVDTDSSKIKYKLILNESTVLEVYGNILIQGLLGFSDQAGYQGHTSGNHSQIINNGTINLNSGAILDLRGYIKGTGTVEARSGAKVYSPFVVRDFRGGTSSSGTYFSGVSPFNVYEMPNIQCLYHVKYGATHTAYMDLFGNGKHNSVTNNAIASSSAIFILKESSGLIKTYDRDSEKTTITIYGNVEWGDLSMELSGATIKMSKVRFPIPWNYNINIGDGIATTRFDAKNDYKIMTGATVNVKKNATVNLTGTVVIYKEFTDQAHAGWVYPNKEPAKFCVEGEVSVSGELVSKAGIAGEITGLNGGKIIIGKKYVNLQLSSKEGHATGLFSDSFVEVAKISATAELVNANGNKITAETNKTYNYNNGTWQ